MEKLGNNSKMATKVTFCSFWYSFAALYLILAFHHEYYVVGAYPGDQDVLWQRCVRILDLDEGKLDAAIRKLIHQVE